MEHCTETENHEGTLHVYPIEDLQEHVVGSTHGECWCNPEMKEGGRVAVHKRLLDHPQ